MLMDNSSMSVEGCPDESVLHGFQDQSLSIFNSTTNQWFVLLLACMMACVVTMNVIGKIFIMWYVKFQSTSRPLNAMILIDQGIQLLPVLVTGIGNTVCLVLQKPLVNYIGEKGCKLYSMFILAHNMSLIIGGAGMAMYRLSIYRFALKISHLEYLNYIPIYATLVWFAITLTQIVTSNELRSFLLD